MRSVINITRPPKGVEYRKLSELSSGDIFGLFDSYYMFLYKQEKTDLFRDGREVTAYFYKPLNGDGTQGTDDDFVVRICDYDIIIKER